MRVTIVIPLMALMTGCGSRESAAPQIRAEEVWSRPAIALPDEVGGMGVVYLTLINDGEASDRLVSIQSEVAELVEIHGARMEKGRMTMQAVAGGFRIPAKGRVEFKSGGYHLMLMRLKRNLEHGDRFKLVLNFEKSGALTVESQVRQR